MGLKSDFMCENIWSNLINVGSFQCFAQLCAFRYPQLIVELYLLHDELLNPHPLKQSYVVLLQVFLACQKRKQCAVLLEVLKSSTELRRQLSGVRADVIVVDSLMP